jgi:hypothetical protein
MLTTGYKLRLGTTVLWAAALAFAGREGVQAQTLFSAFDGNLSSSIGVDWEIRDIDDATPGAQLAPFGFIPSDTGQAIEIGHNTGWTMPIRLVPPAGAPRTALIDLFASSDSLEFDVVTGPQASNREVFVILNSNAEFTNWSQVQVNPVVNSTYHVSLPLTDPGNGTNWKQEAQDALANNPIAPTYWELWLVFQGTDLPLTADFDFDSNVDGGEFLTWQKNYGNSFAGPEEGDTNFDAIVDEFDLAAWASEFGRDNLHPRTAIDNVQFVSSAGVGAVPEPSTLAIGGLGAGLAWLAAGRRRRSS